MNNLSYAMLEGYVTQEPELRKTKTDKSVMNFTIALNHGEDGDDGSKEVSFFTIEVWDKLAEICAQYLKKGKGITAQGYLRQDRWQDGEGKTHSRVKLRAQTVRFNPMPANLDQEEEAA